MRIGPSIVAVVLVVASCSAGDESEASVTTGAPVVTTTGSQAPAGTTTASPSTSPSTSSSTMVDTTTTTDAPAPTTTTEAPDTVAPQLTVTDPPAGASVTTRAYRFAGTTEPGATVVAAGRYPAAVAADGTWSIVLMLNSGGNVATFVATDSAGNSTEVRVPVYLQACADSPEVEMAAAATDVETLTADLDGDGEPDAIATYLAGGTWRLHVELAYGWETETDITAYVTDVPPPSPARRVDLGLPTVVVNLGGNLVGASFGFVGLAGCALQPVVRPDGDMPDIWVGVGIPHAEFFRCEAGAVTQVQMARSESSIAITETRYPFSTGSVTFGAPTITDEEIAAPMPTDGSPDIAWDDEVARRRASACLP